MSRSLVCADCDTRMDLIHGGHMMIKSIYHYCCPDCKKWTTLEEGDEE